MIEEINVLVVKCVWTGISLKKVYWHWRPQLSLNCPKPNEKKIVFVESKISKKSLTNICLSTIALRNLPASQFCRTLYPTIPVHIINELVFTILLGCNGHKCKNKYVFLGVVAVAVYYINVLSDWDGHILTNGTWYEERINQLSKYLKQDKW